MARILAIDWELRTLHVVAANAKRKSAVVEGAFTLTLSDDLTPANGETLGRMLRDALKLQGIAPAPVVVCVGRDRLLVKDIEYPVVADADEPGLVRMQAAKHLEGTEDLVIDYAPIGLTGSIRQSIIVAVKRTVVAGWQAFCRGAGLKLAACTPRPLAWMAALERHQAGQPGEMRAVLGMGPRWSEFCIYRGAAPLLARSLATGPTLGAEVQRNLTLLNTRTGAAPSVLFVAGCEDETRLKLLTDGYLGEIKTFRPIVNGDAALSDPAPYAAAIGLAHLYSQSDTLPINWAAPKEPKVNVNKRKEWSLATAGIGALALLILLIVGWRTFAGKRQTIDQLKKEDAALAKELKGMEEDIANNDALRDWEDSTISWLDELYDLSARFPNELGLHLKQINAKVTVPLGRKDRGKEIDSFVASMNIAGVVPPGKDGQVERLQKKIQQDKHLRVTPGKTLSSGTKSGEFEFTVDVTKVLPEARTLKLDIPKQPAPAVPTPPAASPMPPASTPPTTPPATKETGDGEEGGEQP